MYTHAYFLEATIDRLQLRPGLWLGNISNPGNAIVWVWSTSQRPTTDNARGAASEGRGTEKEGGAEKEGQQEQHAAGAAGAAAAAVSTASYGFISTHLGFDK